MKNWKSIVVEKDIRGSEHDKFSKAWISTIGHDGKAAGWTGKNTSNATIFDIG